MEDSQLYALSPLSASNPSWSSTICRRFAVFRNSYQSAPECNTWGGWWNRMHIQEEAQVFSLDHCCHYEPKPTHERYLLLLLRSCGISLAGEGLVLWYRWVIRLVDRSQPGASV